MDSIFVVWSLFFKKTLRRKRNLSRFRFRGYRSEFCCSLPLFGLFFCQLVLGKEREFLYSLGVTTYLFRRKTRAFAKKKKEERRAKERVLRGRESVRWSFHTFIYYCSIHYSSSRERENFFPFFQGEKRRRLVVHRFCERHARGKKALRKEEETVLVRLR